MNQLLRHMTDRLLRYTDRTTTETLLPRATIAIARASTRPELTMLGPGVCLVLQGTKRLQIGSDVLVQGSGTSIASLIEAPATRCLQEGDNGQPYVAIGLMIDRHKLSDLLADLALPVSTGSVPSLSIGEDADALLSAWDNFTALLDAPDEIPALAAPRERELMFRLLQSPHGPLLRQIADDGVRLGQIRKAIDWIRANLDDVLRIDSLAEMTGMSIPAFNRHFRKATRTSPLQYQKSLRLQDARLLLAKGNDVTRTAYSVGYKSVPQFSREYKRHFGRPPMLDATLVRKDSSISGMP